ncbi:MAG: phytanoyl-CoA dioxygenase family protein [Pseudomonadota bacterium]
MQPHAKNTDFTWRSPAAPFALVSQAQADAYDRLGGFVLEDAFSSAEVDAVLAALDPLEAQANAALRKKSDAAPSIARADEIIFDAHVVTRSEVLREFATHSVFVALCQDLIGPAVRLYWDQLVYKRPGTVDEFPWHQDNGYTYVEPQHYLTCWVALTDATPDNGCPWIAPGVHRQGTLRHRWTDIGFRCLERPEDALPLPARAGSVVVFSSLTPHMTGPNLTDEVRKSYILQYAPDGALVHPHFGGEPQLASDPQRQFMVTA